MKRFGIVGAGIIGASHKAALEKLPDCTIAAVCDLAAEKAALLAQGTEARIYTDYRQMCEQEALDAVILNLPHFLHKEVSIYFLERHIPVLVEKPMANTVAECDEMLAAAEKNHTVLAVGHVQRYYDCYRQIRSWIQNGSLGKLCQITEVRNTDYFSPDRPRWFLSKKQSGGGILMNYGAHTLDKLLYTTGLQVERVAALGNNFLTGDDVEASAQVLVKLSGNVTVLASYCGTRVPEQYETHFYFTEGVARVLNGQKLYVSGKGSAFRYIEPAAQEDIFVQQLREFLKLLDGQPSEMATGDYGRQVICVLEQALGQIDISEGPL